MFDSSGAGLSQMPILLHTNPAKIPDLTAEIIKELNKDAPAGYIPGAPSTLPDPDEKKSILPGVPVEPAGGS